MATKRHIDQKRWNSRKETLHTFVIPFRHFPCKDFSLVKKETVYLMTHMTYKTLRPIYGASTPKVNTITKLSSFTTLEVVIRAVLVTEVRSSTTHDEQDFGTRDCTV